MRHNDTTSPSGVLAAATQGAWSSPIPWNDPVDRNRRGWRVTDPTGRFELFRLHADQASTPTQARANAIMLAEARTMWELVLRIADSSYATQAADLIDGARATLAAARRRANSVPHGVAGSTPHAEVAAPPVAVPPVQAREGQLEDAATATAGCRATASDAPQTSWPDTIIVYADSASGPVCTRVCPYPEATALMERAMQQGLTAVLHQVTERVDLQFLLDVSPDLRARITQSVDKVRRDNALLEAMDAHDIPRDRDLRAKIARLIAADRSGTLPGR